MAKLRRGMKVRLNQLTPRQRRQVAGTGKRNLVREYKVVPKGASKKTAQYGRYSTNVTIDKKKVTLVGRERRKLGLKSKNLVSFLGPAKSIYKQRTSRSRKRK